MAFADRVAATGSILFAAEMIFVIAAVHDTRVTTPALMDLPVDLRSDPTASDRYRRGAFKSIYGHARVVAASVRIFQRSTKPRSSYHRWISLEPLETQDFFAKPDDQMTRINT